jgi:predicted MPP superfamily phosphohydrolase
VAYRPSVVSFRRWWAALPWLAAAACLAIPAIDRSLDRADTDSKRCFILAVVALSSCGALAAARLLQRGPARLLPFGILLLALGAQGRELLIRHRSAASGPVRSVGVAASLAHPITTTDLVTHFYELPEPALRVRRLRVAQISDWHISARLPKAYFEHALDSVVAEQPDLVALTGDYVSHVESLPLLAQVLGGRLKPRLGVFAVLGNHDFWAAPDAVRRTLSAAGITLLGSGCVRLPESTGRVSVCGTEAPWGPKREAALPAGELSLVLSHTPDNIYALSALGASVVFSGHTHGGQLRLPGLGALIIPSRYGRRFDEGHFLVGSTHLFVSTGLGADEPALRVYCRPDVIIVDLLNDSAS